MKPLLLLMAVLLLAGCTHLPPAIDDAPKVDLGYGQVIGNVDQHRKAPLRWGGVVVKVDNEQDASLVQVLYYPLAKRGRPLLNREPLGRFVFKTTEFLDPVIYARNRLVTVAGVLDGQIQRTVGKKNLWLPLLKAEHIHLWPLRTTDRCMPGGFGGFGFAPMGFWPHWRAYPGPFAPHWSLWW